MVSCSRSPAGPSTWIPMRLPRSTFSTASTPATSFRSSPNPVEGDELPEISLRSSSTGPPYIRTAPDRLSAKVFSVTNRSRPNMLCSAYRLASTRLRSISTLGPDRTKDTVPHVLDRVAAHHRVLGVPERDAVATERPPAERRRGPGHRRVVVRARRARRRCRLLRGRAGPSVAPGLDRPGAPPPARGV